MLFLSILIFFLLVIAFFFVGFSKEKENLEWGVNFSAKHNREMGLDLEKTYFAILDDLKARKIKIAVHWDEFEKEEGIYNFKEIDFMIDEAEKRGAEVVLAIGMKTPRWPECHIPSWAKSLDKIEQQEKILKKIEAVVLKYEKRENIKKWQVENEPFFPFGDCPWADIDFLKKEVGLVKSISKKPVIITDTGELSLWIRAAKIGDIVGSTMYRKVWFSELKRHISYPVPATFYKRKNFLINLFFKKEVIGSELQAEPWGSTLLYYSPIEEQEKSMDINQLKQNISFAKKVGFKENYLWGVEWWFWMKEKHNEPIFWEEAKKLWE